MNWSNETILKIAMKQSAFDANCSAEDFLCEKNVIAISKPCENARKYLKLPHACNLISYGKNIVATISDEYREIVENYINRFAVEHCFETPNMHVLNDAFEKHGFRVCFMAEYFLPDLNVLAALPCDFELKLLGPADFANLYLPEWAMHFVKNVNIWIFFVWVLLMDKNLLVLQVVRQIVILCGKLELMFYQNIGKRELLRL